MAMMSMPCASSYSRTTRTPLVNPYVAAERGYVDAVIPPSHTRGYIATALRASRTQAHPDSAQEARQHSSLI